eukprot:1160490-Pelagomonas_calceolata.AAC.8
MPQDDVPSFPDEIAFEIIEEELGKPIDQVFSSFSERPIAAASLGQVGCSVESDAALMRKLGSRTGPHAFVSEEPAVLKFKLVFVVALSNWILFRVKVYTHTT